MQHVTVREGAAGSVHAPWRVVVFRSFYFGRFMSISPVSMACETLDCQQVKAFVEECVAGRSGVAVLDARPSGLMVKLSFPGRCVQRPVLENPEDRWDERTKNELRRWIDSQMEPLNVAAEMDATTPTWRSTRKRHGF